MVLKELKRRRKKYEEKPNGTYAFCETIHTMEELQNEIYLKIPQLIRKEGCL